MNRYIIEGIINDMLSGKRVLIIDALNAEAKTHLRAVAERVKQWPELQGVVGLKSKYGVEQLVTNEGGKVTAIGLGIGKAPAFDVLVVTGSTLTRHGTDLLTDVIGKYPNADVIRTESQDDTPIGRGVQMLKDETTGQSAPGNEIPPPEYPCPMSACQSGAPCESKVCCSHVQIV